MDLISGYSTMTPGIELAENYYKWIFRTIRPFIAGRVLEIGAGYGNIAGYAADGGFEYIGVDSDAAVVEKLTARFRGRANVKVYDAADRGGIALETEKGIDTVISMNVLEHAEDDGGHVKLAAGLMKKGRLILFVPAMEILYGSMDRQAGHYRRYSKTRIKKIMESNSLNIVKLTYFNSLGALGWFVSCRLLKIGLNSVSAGKLALFYDRAVVPFARLLDPALRPFFGQSLICVAEKK